MTQTSIEKDTLQIDGNEKFIKDQRTKKYSSLPDRAECCDNWDLSICQIGHIRFVTGRTAHRTGLCG